MKTCSKCHATKLDNQFYKRYQGDNRLHSWCKGCKNQVKAVWKKANPDRNKGYELKMKYGITIHTYKLMKVRQKNCCAICKLEKPLVVDHCHTTGKVRGLLCSGCNIGLGAFVDCNASLLEAVNYIKKAS